MSVVELPGPGRLPDGQWAIKTEEGDVVVCHKLPAWRLRNSDQVPMFVSTEGEKLLRWSFTVEPRSRSMGLHTYKAGEFSPADAMDWRFPGHKHGDPKCRAWWDDLREELNHANLLREVGWSAYRATSLARELLGSQDCEITRLY